VGFEPTIGLLRCRFSRPVHSTALPPLRYLPHHLAAIDCASTIIASFGVNVSILFPLCPIRRARASPAPCRSRGIAYLAKRRVGDYDHFWETEVSVVSKQEQKLKALEWFKDWSNYMLITTVAALGWVAAAPVYHGWGRRITLISLTLSTIFR